MGVRKQKQKKILFLLTFIYEVIRKLINHENMLISSGIYHFISDLKLSEHMPNPMFILVKLKHRNMRIKKSVTNLMEELMYN